MCTAGSSKSDNQFQLTYISYSAWIYCAGQVKRRLIILGFLAFNGLLSFAFWNVAPEKGVPVATWLGRFLCPIGCAVSLLALFRKPESCKGIAGTIGRLCPSFYSRDGLNFLVRFQQHGSCLEVIVIFQNCYSNFCDGVIELAPPPRTLGIHGDRSLTFRVPVRCRGGACGFTRFPVPIPVSYQGTRQRLLITCRARYTGGRGERLIGETCTLVGSGSIDWIGGIQDGLARVLDILSHHLFPLRLLADQLTGQSAEASLTLDLPTGLADSAEFLPPLSMESLWSPGDDPVEKASMWAAIAESRANSQRNRLACRAGQV